MEAAVSCRGASLLGGRLPDLLPRPLLLLWVAGYSLQNPGHPACANREVQLLHQAQEHTTRVLAEGSEGCSLQQHASTGSSRCLLSCSSRQSCSPLPSNRHVRRGHSHPACRQSSCGGPCCRPAQPRQARRQRGRGQHLQHMVSQITCSHLRQTAEPSHDERSCSHRLAQNPMCLGGLPHSTQPSLPANSPLTMAQKPD